ncbi:YheC/YheD family protein [Brucellaceae bacterium D45D]
MERSDEKQIVIGMLRTSGKPGPVARAAAHAAAVQGAKLYFFTPDDVDLKNKKISGLYYAEGTWVRETVGYPNVIENDESSRSAKEVWAELTQYAPITTHMLGGKLVVKRLMQRAGLYQELLIPGEVIKTYSEFTENLHRFGRSVVKPVRGAMGRDIFFFSRTANGLFEANLSGESVILDGNSTKKFYESHIRGNNFLHQKYIESRTSTGLPFDIRLHVRRDHTSRWKTIKVYARIGCGRTVASNLSAGGSIASAASFLRYQFGQQSEAIIAKLNLLARNFPGEFQKLYPDQMLDALGIDIGIDSNGRPWLFEVNSFPGSMFFELEDAIPKVGYAIYLAKKANKLSDSDGIV